MTIKPILFNTEMVLANLEDRKTNTRRLVKPQPDIDGLVRFDDVSFVDTDARLYKPPYQPGDILYVRETWAQCPDLFGEFPEYIYRADYSTNDLKMDDDSAETYSDFPACVKWHPSIHMPKEAARLFLRVTDVRVERLQDIDGLGAYNEGAVAEMPGACLPPIKPRGFDDWSTDKKNDHIRSMATSAYIAKLEYADRLIKAFARIWDSTIKAADREKYGWDANPWVWVIEYERISKEEAGESDESMACQRNG